MGGQPRAVRKTGARSLELGLLLALGLGACARGGVRDPAFVLDGDPVMEDDAGLDAADAGDGDGDDEDGLPDASSPPEPDAGLPEPDAGMVDPVASCIGTSTCPLAVNLGSISGDTSGASIIQTGSTSAFFTLQITEDDHGFLSPKELGFKVALSSPSTDFDLFLYAEGDGCGTVSDSSTGTAAEEVGLRWSDDQGFGGVDSARTALIEVRHKAGTCDPAQPWTLSITGNL